MNNKQFLDISGVKHLYSKIISKIENRLDPPSRNLLTLPNYSKEKDGVSIVIEDGTFTIIGTAEKDIALNIPIDTIPLKKGTYYYAAKNVRSFEKQATTVFIKSDSTNRISYVSASLNPAYNQKKIELENDTSITYISIGITSGYVVDQTFNLQLELGEKSTSYLPANRKIFQEDIVKSVEDLESNTVFANAFGAVGDGVTDDTVALQNAIDYCTTNYKLLKLDSGKVYLISQPLVWDKSSIYFDGNFSTITTNSSIDDLIQINCIDINDSAATGDWGVRNYRQQVIENLILNCGGWAKGGLRIEKGIKTTCSNLTINNPLSYGIYINQGGYENFVNNIHITRYLDSLGGTGLYVYGSDNTFTNVVTIGCEIGVINVGGDNHYDKVHPWSTTRALENLKNSISFDCRNGYCTFSQCMGDSTNIIFRMSNSARAMISNCANTWSDTFINAISESEENKELYLFYFVNEDIGDYIHPHENKGDDVIISTSYFKPKIVDNNDSIKCYYSNLTENDKPLFVDKTVSGWNNTPNTTNDKLNTQEVINIEYNLDLIEPTTSGQSNSIVIQNGIVYGTLDFSPKIDFNGEVLTKNTFPTPPVNFSVECTPFNTDEFVGTSVIIVSGEEQGLVGVGLRPNHRYLVSFSYPVVIV